MYVSVCMSGSSVEGNRTGSERTREVPFINCVALLCNNKLEPPVQRPGEMRQQKSVYPCTMGTERKRKKKMKNFCCRNSWSMKVEYPHRALGFALAPANSVILLVDSRANTFARMHCIYPITRHSLTILLHRSADSVVITRVYNC